HVLLRDQVLELELLLGRDDLGAPVVVTPVRLLDLEQLLADHAVDLRLVAEDLPELADALLLVVVVALHFVALERGQLAQAQLEDRQRLGLAELELLHEPYARLVGVGGGADEGDDLVEDVEGLEVALEDVDAGLELAQLVLRAAGDDLALEVEVMADELEQRERARDAVDERDGVVAERRLQGRVLEELVERHLRNRVALELDLDAHPAAVRVVGEIGDLGQDLLLHEVGDLANDAGVA